MALQFIPNAGQTLADTRDPIRLNFVTINNAFLVDHQEYNLANQGQHKQVTLLDNAAAGIITTNGLYSQTYAVGIGATNKPEIWVQAAAGAGENLYPMTASTLSNTPALGNNQPGWSYTPSGLLIKWGYTQTNAAPKDVNLNFGGITGGPNFGAIFSVMVTPVNVVGTPSTAWVVGITGAFHLQFYSNPGNIFCYWLAIGRE